MSVSSLSIQRRTHMILEQGEVINETITKIRAGRITRRTFLERAIAVGLTSSAAVSLLEACGGTSNSTGGAGKTVNINFIQKDTNGVYAGLVKQFNAQNNGVHVTYNSNAPSRPIRSSRFSRRCCVPDLAPTMSFRWISSGLPSSLPMAGQFPWMILGRPAIGQIICHCR